MKRLVSLPLLLLGLQLACGEAAPPATPDAGTEDGGGGSEDGGDVDAGTTPDEPVVIPQKLSELGLFDGPPGADGLLVPTEGNLPYTLNSTLFSDYAAKQRTIRIPPGRKARYHPTDVLDLPVGTILTKTFSYPADERSPNENVRVVETRIFVHQPSGWEGWPYLWDAEQRDAKLVPGGRVVPVSFVDGGGATKSFNYLVPSRNQCQQCHHLQNENGDQILRPIGPKARYLNRDMEFDGVSRNQLEHLAELGLLEGLPAEDVPRAPNAFDPTQGSLDERARTYLDINCAHCHQERGTAGITSQLFLNVSNTKALNLGICKRPGSAGSEVGGTFDIVPGRHDQSILWFRLQTEESGKMMPQLGRTIRHDEGAQLIADWIDSMEPHACE